MANCSDCKPLYCMTVAERSVRAHGLLLVMLGDEDNEQECQSQVLMGCEAISMRQTAGILWFWCLFMVIFSIMTKEGLIVIELHNVPYSAAVCRTHAILSWCL